MNKKLAILPLLLLFACKPVTRIAAEDEPDRVGEYGAGAATYEILVTDTVKKLLDKQRTDFAVKIRTIAFVGLENKTAEELGEWREMLIEKIENAINDHPVHQVIAHQYIQAALSEMGNPPIDKLFIPKNQREFQKILERQDKPFHYILYGNLTRGRTLGDGTEQKNYLLTLQMVDIANGTQSREQTEVRKIRE